MKMRKLPSNQKTLFSYFVKQEKDLETLCKACGKLIQSSKLIWHKDFQCEFISHLNLNRSTIASRIKKRRIKKEKIESNNGKPKKLINQKTSLCNNPPEVICLDLSDSDSSISNYAGSSKAKPCNPLFDLEDDIPPAPKQENECPAKISVLDILAKDWESPSPTPIKREFNENANDHNVKKEPIGNICEDRTQLHKDLTANESKISNASIKKEIIHESSNSDLKKDTSTSHSNISANRYSHSSIHHHKKDKSLENLSDFSLISDTNSEDEFTDVEFNFSTPENLKKSKIKLSSSKKKAKIINNSLGDLKNISSQSNTAGNVHDATDTFVSEMGTPLYTPRLVTPERTPTPSPDKFSNCDKKLIEFSPKILASPNHFNLTEAVEKQSQVDASLIFSSEIAANSKGSPRSLYKSLQKTCFQNGYITTPLSKVRRNLYTSQSFESDPSNMVLNKNPVTSPRNEPSRFRNVKGMYLENFLHILDVVTSQGDDLELFNEEDLRVIKGFHQLTLEAQKLYVRLFQRKIKWNKVSKLDYKDICEKDDFPLYVNELVYAGYLHSEKSLTNLSDILELLDVTEIRSLCRTMKITATGNKDQLFSRIFELENQQKSICSSFSASRSNKSKVYELSKKAVQSSYIVIKEYWEVFMRVLLLYSPTRFEEDEESGHQNQLTMLLMVSLGKMKFPNYKVLRNLSIFTSRQDLIRYQKCLHIEFEIQDCIKKQDWEKAIDLCKDAQDFENCLLEDQEVLKHDNSLPPFLRRFTTMSLLYHIRTLAVESYQRLKQYGCAVKQLEFLLAQKTHLQDYRGRWYERLAINLHHLKRNRKCLEVIKEALEDPEVRIGHQLTLSQKAERMLSLKATQKLGEEFKKQLRWVTFQEAPKVIIQGKSLSSDVSGYKRIFLTSGRNGEENTMCSVEELVINHYKEEGYPEGLHCEGRTVAGLFGLFFWDILYMPIPDVFRSSHQAAPLDLDSPHFYQSRKEKIEKRLRKLVKLPLKKANSLIEKVWASNENVVSLVDWKIFKSVNFVQGLVAGLGTKLIAAICRRLAEDHRFTRSGFPDLIVWNPEEQKSRIVEVKGPNDKLSTKQILWLDFLLKNGGVAEVCHVEAVGPKRSGELKVRRELPKKSNSSQEDQENDDQEDSAPKAKRRKRQIK